MGKILILGKKIERVQIIDDESEVRDSYIYSVEDLKIRSVLAEGPLPPLQKFIQTSLKESDAAICDFKLRVKNYASFNGAEVVADFYKARYPAILCTKYVMASIDDIRVFRRYIPVIYEPDDLNPDSFIKGLEICIKEFKGKYSPSRRPWRTLVRIESSDDNYFYVLIPAWDQTEIVRVFRKNIPPEIRRSLRPNKHLHAWINVNAQNNHEIYFYGWEGK